MKVIRSVNKGAVPPPLPARRISRTHASQAQGIAIMTMIHVNMTSITIVGEQNPSVPVTRSFERGMNASAPQLHCRDLKSYGDHSVIIKQDSAPPEVFSTTVPNESNIEISAPVKLGHLATKHLKSYPFRLRVLQGYCSNTSDVTISTGDIYDVHSKQEMMFAVVKGSSGLVYRIPHSSLQKVGIIYNPTNSDEKGLKGYIFKSGAELLACPFPPKVVCCTKDAKNIDGIFLVMKNEVLIVRHTQHKPKNLTVYSMLSCTEKTLPLDCEGYYSTKPSLIQLTLHEIVANIPDPFPLEAVVYTSADSISSPVKHGN